MKKFLIKVNGNQYEVEVEELGGQTFDQPAAIQSAPAPAAAPAAPAAAPAATPVAAPSAPAAPKAPVTGAAGATKITSPMPGTILKTNVNPGDAVKKNQVLLILEAMKMENEIVAPADGTIATVNVSKGTTVNAGDLLVSLS